ncbi:MAG: PaaI family thioesterase [Desulfopila sp.]
MDTMFEQVGKQGFMGHSGGFEFRRVSTAEFAFRAAVREIHLNAGGICHGGYLMTLLDSGMGSAVYRALGGDKRIATISLDVKFVAAARIGNPLAGSATIIRITRSLVFVRGELQQQGKVVATAEGVWKILSR